MKDRPKVREAVRVQPGDLVAVILEGPSTAEAHDQMLSALQSLWPEVKVALFDDVADVVVLRPDQDVWILGHWTPDAEVGSKLLTANWHLDGAFLTRDDAEAAGKPNEFLGRLPLGRAPEEETVLLDVEWIKP